MEDTVNDGGWLTSVWVANRMAKRKWETGVEN